VQALSCQYLFPICVCGALYDVHIRAAALQELLACMQRLTRSANTGLELCHVFKCIFSQRAYSCCMLEIAAAQLWESEA
jgi:hypothetical protein